MSKNENLNSAARAKKDKFYTQLEDIENELHHYREFFTARRFFVTATTRSRVIFLNILPHSSTCSNSKKLITASLAIRGELAL